MGSQEYLNDSDYWARLYRVKELHEKIDALKAENASQLAALKAHHENGLVIDALSLAGLDDELDAIGKAIADAEEARKSDSHVCDVELPEHDDLPSIAYEELPEGDNDV